MWPFGVFLVISSAVAAAGPIDGPARPAPEVEGASAHPTEGTGADAAAVSRKRRAPPIPAQSPEPATRCGQFR